MPLAWDGAELHKKSLTKAKRSFALLSQSDERQRRKKRNLRLLKKGGDYLGALPQTPRGTEFLDLPTGVQDL